MENITKLLPEDKNIFLGNSRVVQVACRGTKPPSPPPLLPRQLYCGRVGTYLPPSGGTARPAFRSAQRAHQKLLQSQRGCEINAKICLEVAIKDRISLIPAVDMYHTRY